MSHRLKIEYFWDRTELNLLVKFFPGLESVGSRFESVPCASRFLCLPAPKWRAKYYKYNASIHTNHVTLGGQPPLMIMTLCCFFHLGRGLNKKSLQPPLFRSLTLLMPSCLLYVPCFSGPFVRDDCLMWMSKWFWQMMQWLSPKPQWIPDAFPAATGWLVFSFFLGDGSTADYWELKAI